MMIKGERYIQFLMKIHAQSGLSKVEEISEAISDNGQEGFTRSRKLTMKGLLHKKKTVEREEEKSIAD